jgi:hypothetical protein
MTNDVYGFLKSPNLTIDSWLILWSGENTRTGSKVEGRSIECRNRAIKSFLIVPICTAQHPIAHHGK